MEEELEDVLGSMHPERLYDWSEGWRNQLSHQVFLELNPDFPAKARAQFSDLLRARWMTARDYGFLTSVWFEDDATMYEFLDRSYRYIFEGEDFDDPPFPPTV
ncbi:hypothetical protein ACWIGI_26905 [Nocardia sp. NPDC055321]